MYIYKDANSCERIVKQSEMLYINKKGFLLLDTLLCIAILSVIIQITLLSTSYRYQEKQRIYQKENLDGDYIKSSNHSICIAIDLEEDQS